MNGVSSADRTPRQSTVTGLLRDWRKGDAKAREKLWSIVYAQLKKLAHFVLEDRGARRPLRTTELVHEAYVKLLSGETLTLNDRRHFFAVIARAMRQILVDHARHALRAKCGAGQEPLPLEEMVGLPVRIDVDLLALDEALKELEKLDQRQHHVVELTYFGGFTYQEISEVLGVSPATVKRDLRTAKMWLLCQLRSEDQA